MGVPENLRERVFEGRIELPRTGVVVEQAAPAPIPYVVLDADGVEIEACTSFLRDLVLVGSSPLTVKSYAHDLLRWWRLLSLVDVTWDRAGRDEVELLVGWLRTARNPQRTKKDPNAAPSGSVNLRTGKPSLDTGYAASTINHALSVLLAFYEFHMQFGRGPLVNPVPIASERRRLLGHRSPIEAQVQHRRAPLRQKQPRRLPRSIPDRLWDELFASMGNHRDRALLAFYVSSGARASELLGMLGEHVDWAGKRIWVVSKGSRTLMAVPGSPEAFGHLALYFDQFGTPGPKDPVWRTSRGASRQLTYWAMRRILQRANEKLGTNWSLHDLRHTAATRMANDPELTLPEVQAVLRHRHLSTTEQYLQPRIEELHDKLQEHYARPRQERRFDAGYAPEDIEAVFGG
ncbi:tyrosine-type recombinase/integrase [Mycolicibacterium fortuitum]|uniref:Site-specific integrase n=2 Tax=Mycolicibacterium fortuitum TaxID=1766 RepID=A0AAE5AFR5_MYCFO|nr:site-specific integrase [Mycolicibacterium fortuitum]MDV7194463.1 site-specific integrase [Mycolicibacterium fortuitum]MDV7207907.1 site-specific integrase [Mycolicibacterium fortuitum]MDV7229205.1 site-specific integrase [Mycolicibacterium fortuitum]MDV7260904.1 site-specific integrase [Mycolicibacterium fortuitum]MDV7285913.1 site-specific integrase [Mycolicibacterium fortuitum]